MVHTMLDVDGRILREVRALQQREGRPISKIVSELLADALARRGKPVGTSTLKWVSRPMRALVEPSDKEALYVALDRAGR